MVESTPSQLTKPTLKDNLIAFSVLLLTGLAVFIGLLFNIGFIVGIPLFLYGVYGLIAKRVWALGTFSGDGRLVVNHDSLIFSRRYMVFGIIFSVAFFFISG